MKMGSQGKQRENARLCEVKHTGYWGTFGQCLKEIVSRDFLPPFFFIKLILQGP
jgi:hypothetical protein